MKNNKYIISNTLTHLPVSDTVKSAAYEYLVKTSSVADHLAEHKDKYIAGAAGTALTAAALAAINKQRQKVKADNLRNNILMSSVLGTVGAHGLLPGGLKSSLGVGATAGLATYLLNKDDNVYDPY